MRSRDGNLDFSLSICSVVFLLFSLSTLKADEYLISYRYVVKDATLYNETLSIAKAMKKCVGKPQKELILQNNNEDDLKKIISANSLEFIDYLQKLGFHINHKEVTQNSINKSTIILTLKTTCFKVDFNDKFARITPLK